MSKIYRYKNLTFPIGDNEDVIFTVEVVSDGNVVETYINIPGPNDSEISDSGTVKIGEGSELREGTTVCVTNAINMIHEEDEIRIRYKINGQLLVEHVNPISEEQRPVIILFIKFPI